MPRRSQEIEILRRQNRWYIEDDLTTIVLTPYPETRSTAGGRTRVPGTPRLPQAVRLIPTDRERTSQRTSQGAGNEQIEVAFDLIGDADLEIARYDRFTGPDGLTYAVYEVHPVESAPYIRRASVYVIPPRSADQ